MKVYSVCFLFYDFWYVCFILRCGDFWREHILNTGYMTYYGTLGIIWKMCALLIGCRMLMICGLIWLPWNCIGIWFPVLMLTHLFTWFSTLKCRQKTLDFSAACKNPRGGKPCVIRFCHKCLLNRFGSPPFLIWFYL